MPADHYLRAVAQHIDFATFRPLCASCYSPTRGRPADDPLLLLKLCFLQFHYDPSDRDVVAEAAVHVAFRWFLELSVDSRLPDPSLLSVFRTRLGLDRFRALFQALVAQARAAGLVRDRLRLKAATHVIANVALPTTLRLVAAARERLLAAVAPFAPQAVAAAEAERAAIRARSRDLPEAPRLLARVQQLAAVVGWVDPLVAAWGPPGSPPDAAQERGRATLALAHKILSDQPPAPPAAAAPALPPAPAAGAAPPVSPAPRAPTEPVPPAPAPKAAADTPSDKLRSLVAPEARTGKHGDYVEGYKLDLLVDADSEIITALDLLAANGDEAATATALIQEEEAAQGNDVGALAIDGIGLRGELLREWQDGAGLGLEVGVPPGAAPAETGRFTAAEFRETEDGGWSARGE